MQVADIEKAEKEKMHDKVKAICAHGINCFVNRQLVYNYPEELFADAGVMAIEHADFDGIERLALVTGVIADPMIGSYKGGRSFSRTRASWPSSTPTSTASSAWRWSQV